MRAKLGRSVPVSHALRRPADLYEKARKQAIPLRPLASFSVLGGNHCLWG